jgi:hypothetical protein
MKKGKKGRGRKGSFYIKIIVPASTKKKYNKEVLYQEVPMLYQEVQPRSIFGFCFLYFQNLSCILNN